VKQLSLLWFCILWLFFLVITHFSVKPAFAANSFVDGTSTYGIGDGTSNHSHGSWVDVNLDGRLDLYATSNNSTNKLFINNGSNSLFTEQSNTYGLQDTANQTFSTSWVDIDNDKDFDLYVVHSDAVNDTNHLYVNNYPDPSFTEKTSTYNLANLISGSWNQGATWFDFDLDGDLDVYLVNRGANNKLMINNGPDQAFTDFTDAYGLGDGNSQHISAQAVDFDNDGDFDIYVSNRNSNNKLSTNANTASEWGINLDTPLTTGTYYLTIQSSDFSDNFAILKDIPVQLSSSTIASVPVDNVDDSNSGVLGANDQDVSVEEADPTPTTLKQPSPTTPPAPPIPTPSPQPKWWQFWKWF